MVVHHRALSSAGRARAALIVLLALAALSGACSRDADTTAYTADEPLPTISSEHENDDAEVTFTAVNALLGRAMPLDAYVVDPDGPFTRALDLLTERCMETKGFEYQAASSTDAAADLGGKYVEDLGYLGDPSVLADLTVKRGDAPTHPPGYFDALIGFDPAAVDEKPAGVRGCSEDAYDELVGPDGAPDKDEVVGEIAIAARRDVMRTPSYSAALERWSVCAEPLGLESPSAPVEPTASEFGLSLGCKLSSGLIETYVAELDRAQRRLIDENAGRFAALSRRLDKVDERARQALKQ